MSQRPSIDEDEDPSPALLFTRQAARYCGLSAATLERLRSTNGDGPSYVKLGDKKTSKVAYLRMDLDRWILAHRRRGGAEDEDDR